MRPPKGLSEDRKRLLDFRLSLIQTAALIVAGIWVLFTYTAGRIDEMNSARRELERPLYEKKLALYAEASGIAARLLMDPQKIDDATRNRFWDLYWGELAMVESRAGNSDLNSAPIESLMVAVCGQVFDKGCHDDNARKALTLAHQAGDELQEEWRHMTPWDSLKIWSYIRPAPQTH